MGAHVVKAELAGENEMVVVVVAVTRSDSAHLQALVVPGSSLRVPREEYIKDGVPLEAAKVFGKEDLEVWMRWYGYWTG